MRRVFQHIRWFWGWFIGLRGEAWCVHALIKWLALMLVDVVNRQVSILLNDLGHSLWNQHLNESRSHLVFYLRLCHLLTEHALLSLYCYIVGVYHHLALCVVRIVQVYWIAQAVLSASQSAHPSARSHSVLCETVLKKFLLLLKEHLWVLADDFNLILEQLLDYLLYEVVLSLCLLLTLAWRHTSIRQLVSVNVAELIYSA